MAELGKPFLNGHLTPGLTPEQIVDKIEEQIGDEITDEQRETIMQIVQGIVNGTDEEDVPGLAAGFMLSLADQLLKAMEVWAAINEMQGAVPRAVLRSLIFSMFLQLLKLIEKDPEVFLAVSRLNIESLLDSTPVPLADMEREVVYLRSLLVESGMLEEAKN